MCCWPSSSGRSTLTRSLTSSMSKLDHDTKASLRIDFRSSYFVRNDRGSGLGKRHVVRFCDYEGDVTYEATQSMFFSQSSLFVICVDMQAYAAAWEQARFVFDDKEEDDHALNRFVQEKIVNRVLQIFGLKPDASIAWAWTKSDVLKHQKKRQQKLHSDFMHRVKSYFQKWENDLANRNALECLPHQQDPVVGNLEKVREMLSVCDQADCMSMSLKDSRGVLTAQQDIEELLDRKKRSIKLPQSYARVLRALQALRDGSSLQEPRDRVNSMIRSTQNLYEWLREHQTGLKKEQAKPVLDMLHDIGEIMLFSDLGVRDDDNDVILDAQLMVEFALHLLTSDHKFVQIHHDKLTKLPYWRVITSSTRIRSLKQIFEHFHLAYQMNAGGRNDASLIVPAFWKRMKTYVGQVNPLKAPASDEKRRNVFWKYAFRSVVPFRVFELFGCEPT